MAARTFHLADLTGLSKNLIISEKDIYFNAPNIEAKAFSKKVFTDQSGFRIPKKNYKYKEESSSILILGDSVSFGVGVEEKNTFVGLLRDEFKNINFFNSSVTGYNLKDYSKIVKKNHNIKNLDNVILFFTLNDISYQKTVLNFDEEFKKDKIDENINLFNKLKRNQYLVKLNYFLRNKSVFYMWVRGIVSKPSERHFYYTYPMYKNKNAILNLENQIVELKKVTNGYNLRLIVVLLPYEFQTRLENCNSDFLLPQDKIKTIFNNSNINFFDYTDSFCGDKKPNSLFLKYDPVHLSPQGHKLVFNLLKKSITIK